MPVSRRQLLAGLVGIGTTSSAIGAGTFAQFHNSESASTTLEAGFWVDRVVYVTGSNELATVRDETEPNTYGVSSASVVGPEQSAFGHEYAIPFVTGGGAVKYVNQAGTVETLSTGDTSPRTSKAIVTIGTWNGSPESVFYTASSSIWRVAPSESEPTEVAALGNGAKAVLGVIDIDDDGTDELIYVDGSAIVRYLKPAKETEHNIGGFGSNNQYGVGAPLQTDDGARVPIIDGSNNVAVRDSNGTKTVLTENGPAAKTALAPANINPDDQIDLVFINTSGELRYVTDLTQVSTSQPVTDSSGDPITVDSPVGVL